MDAKDEVKQRLSVEEVVGDYLELKRAGRNLKAISPFTNERTPSFMVSPEKQIWHDFSSNKGGDIFSFIMEVEGVEFREALEILARRANVELAQYQRGDGQTAKLKKRLLEAHRLAVQFYHLCLSKQPEALHYIKDDRHFTPQTIRQWQLGYAPDDGSSLGNFLRKRGFQDSELSKAGLITKRSNGWGDMFRGRIMIPLSDGQGNVVGFTARLLKDNAKAPKYFNTPQTLIYDKGRQVYGFHHAKEAIRKQDAVVLVEGNLDVIASHQSGVCNVVACAGTAMTADHLKSLSRLTSNIHLAFDADRAGLQATERAIPIAQSVGVELSIVQLPDEAKDPDELIQRDPSLWQAAVSDVTDAVSWILQRYSGDFDKTTADGKRQLSTKALGVIRGLTDPVEQEHHLKMLARELDVSIESLNAKLSQRTVQAPRRKEVKNNMASPDRLAYEDSFLCLNSFYPDVRDSLRQITPDMLHTSQRQILLGVLKKAPITQHIDKISDKDLHKVEDYVKILSLIVEQRYQGFQPADLISEAMALARRIYQTQDSKTKERLTAAIRDAEARGEMSRAAELLEQYQALLKGD